MATINSFAHSILEIKNLGEFLVDRGFNFVVDSEYVINYISDLYQIRISSEPYGDATFFEIIDRNTGTAISVFLCAQYDQDIEYKKYIFDGMTKMDFIRSGFSILKKYPEKFFNGDYLLYANEHFNQLIEGDFCVIQRPKE